MVSDDLCQEQIGFRVATLTSYTGHWPLMKSKSKHADDHEGRSGSDSSHGEGMVEKKDGHAQASSKVREVTA